MRRFTTLLLLSYSISLFAQKNCGVKPSDLIPLPDLQGKTYRGFPGGLYSNGSNQRPAAHLAEINEQVAKIKPLNTQGQSDPKGKVVMIGVGASNPRTEFENFKLRCAASSNLNPQLVLVNTCVGGQGVQKMNTPEDNYWQNAASALKSNGLTDQQVQLAWVETDNTQTGDTLFPRAPQQLMEDYRLLLEVLRDKYPNLKVVYFSARSYAGYATPVPGGVGKGLLFPRDYLSGWAIKWLIENAAGQKPGFVTKGTQANIPYVTWGSYHWSNASQPRSDGFVIDCSTDVGEDGLHLTRLGEEKIGQLMFDYFQKDPTSRTWLLQATTTATQDEAEMLPTIQVYPNPFVDNVVLHTSTPLHEASLTLRNLQGVALWQETRDINGETVLSSMPYLAAGLYLLECRQGDKRDVKKILKLR